MQIGQGTAGVGETHGELGQPVEHTSEHEMGGGDGGVERIAEEIVQIVGSEPLRPDDPEGMQKHGQAQRGRSLEDGEEFRIGQLAAPHVGAHVYAADAGKLRRALELGEGAWPILKRHHGAAHEAIGVRDMRRARPVVPGGRQARAGGAVGPVHHGRGEGERLHGHALTIHGLDAETEVPVARVEWGSPGAAHHEHGALRIRAVHARAEGGAGLFDHTDEALRKKVCVDVDAGGLDHRTGILLSMHQRW